MGDADIMVEYRGQWMTYEAFEKARLDVLMPPQPKKQWARSSRDSKAGTDKGTEYRRQLLDARHQ